MSRSKPTIMPCPDCGKVMSTRFPMHECTPERPVHTDNPIVKYALERGLKKTVAKKRKKP